MINDLSRIPANNDIRGHIFCHDCMCSNYRTVSYRYPFHDACTKPDPHIIANTNFSPSQIKFFEKSFSKNGHKMIVAFLFIHGMIIGIVYINIMGNKYAVPYANPHFRPYSRPLSNIAIISNTNFPSIGINQNLSTNMRVFTYYDILSLMRHIIYIGLSIEHCIAASSTFASLV